MSIKWNIISNKKRSADTCYKMNVSWKLYVKRKKPVTKETTYYTISFMWNIQNRPVDIERYIEKAGLWLATAGKGLGGNDEWLLKSMGFLSKGWKCSIISKLCEYNKRYRIAYFKWMNDMVQKFHLHEVVTEQCLENRLEENSYTDK